MINFGLETLLHKRMNLLKGKAAGLVTHPAAVTAHFDEPLTALSAAGIRVAALFGPEHGISGAVADGVKFGSSIDPRSGLPVFSLYGETKQPVPEMLQGIDVLVLDMQDVGVRFYTYINTLFYVLKASGLYGCPVIVLDRPNPINGVQVEGPLLKPGFESFIGLLPIPVRHAMTIGELALYMNAEFKLGAQLQVVEMEGWHRTDWFDQSGRDWVITSPSMPHLSTVICYPGMCLSEGTNLSTGRGTGLPFEITGAPWLDGYALAQELNSLKLSGVHFRPISFTPFGSTYAGQHCEGVQMHITRRDAFRPFFSGLAVIAACRKLAGDQFEFLSTSWEGHPPHFDLLAGSARLRQGIEAGIALDTLEQEWQSELETFQIIRQRYLIYQ